jgi:formate-dependent nitrite reductase membrane component NrfD
MRELILTRQNHLVDPSLHVWAWQIPVYLFLGGLVAGMMVLSGVFMLQGRSRERPCTCTMTPWAGLVLLSVGMFALFLDLEHKLYTWRLYTTFQVASPMSWGAWILVIVYPALMAAALVAPPAWLRSVVLPLERFASAVGTRPVLIRWIGMANVGLGAALGIYTGILLSALGARPLWNSALELAIIGLFVIGLASAAQAYRDAADLVLGGAYTAVFWVGVVGLGIVLPLIVQSMAVRHRVQHTPVAPLLVLAGGLILRVVIVSAGQASRWAAVLQAVGFDSLV